MSNPVMVSLDGSEKDARALVVGAALADVSGDDLHLVRVFDTPIASLSGRAGRLGVVDAARELRENVRRDTAHAAHRAAEDARRPVTWDVLDDVDVAGALTQHAAQRDARFVVMGTRAAGAVGRTLRGSIADRVMRESLRPVVLVPPAANFASGTRAQIARVLVPLDGSELSAKALDYLLALPHADRLEYVLLEVRPRGAERVAAEAEQRLAAAADRVRARGAQAVETAVVEADEPAEAITATIREALVDLIAMSTRGAGGLRRLVLGSVAEGVVRTSEVPVMLITPAGLGDGQLP
jgi:nucleotide-binding universal stress UspA family protein